MVTQNVVNGVNVDQLVATINAIKDNPSLAYFKFRATNEWVNGGHSRTRVQSFTVAGQEDASRSKPFVLEGDEPPVLLGSNAGPNAVEAVLHALASCLAVGFIYNAAAQVSKWTRWSSPWKARLTCTAFWVYRTRCARAIKTYACRIGLRAMRRAKRSKPCAIMSKRRHPCLTSSATRCW